MGEGNLNSGSLSGLQDHWHRDGVLVDGAVPVSNRVMLRSAMTRVSISGSQDEGQDQHCGPCQYAHVQPKT